MRRMRAALNIYDTFSSMASAKNKAEWGDANPGAVDLIFEVRRMRREKDGE